MLPLKVVDVEQEGTVIVTEKTKFMIGIGSMDQLSSEGISLTIQTLYLYISVSAIVMRGN